VAIYQRDIQVDFATHTIVDHHAKPQPQEHGEVKGSEDGKDVKHLEREKGEGTSEESASSEK
jgi:hypothetical protein